MSDELDDLDFEIETDEEKEPRRWNTTSFITGIVVGAAVGAGMALLLAPSTGEETRRAIRKRVKGMSKDAAGGWVTTRQEVRRVLKEKKAALKEKMEEMAASLDEN
jgi:gas vesicle protein